MLHFIIVFLTALAALVGIIGTLILFIWTGIVVSKRWTKDEDLNAFFGIVLGVVIWIAFGTAIVSTQG